MYNEKSAPGKPGTDVFLFFKLFSFFLKGLIKKDAWNMLFFQSLTTLIFAYFRSRILSP